MFDTLRAVMRFRSFERDPVVRRLRGAADISDLRRIARRRLPAGVFDYIDGAAEDERTLHRNSQDLADIGFAPRVMTGLTDIDASTNVLGKPVPFPLILAPTGFTRIADPQGELAVARSAEHNDIPYCLSTLSTRSIEEVAAVSHGRHWFQVYVWKDKALVAHMLERAKAAGFEAIVITVDAPVIGRRERDVRRGFNLPPTLGPGTVIDGMLHPGWTWDFVRAEPIVFANVVGAPGTAGDGSDPIALAAYAGEQFDPGLRWEDIAWFKDRWDGPIVVKGVQTVADAVIAADLGVDAIALSNHGGRQLDGAPSPISLVGPVADAVGDRTEIYCDGGVRRGSDIVKAVGLGATACMAGRAYLYGLGAGGQRGVDHAIDLLRTGMERTMTLLGTSTVDAITRDHLRP